MISIQVSELLKDSSYNLNLEILSGRKGLDKKITIPRIQKPGLALTGDTSNLHAGRIQVIGKSEVNYLNNLSESKLTTVVKKICEIDLACFVVTRGNQPPNILLDECESKNIPIFITNLITSTFINRVSKFLEYKLTATTSLHGVLLDVFGVGVIIIGKSGIGKSECALDLILRGHRLVADDIVQIKKRPPATLSGMGTELIKHHMEIRGLGIINIKDLFGVAAIRDTKVIEIVVELIEWGGHEEYDRLGIDDKYYSILDVKIPYIRIPVRPGRNITTIVEVAARNHLLKLRGHFSAKEFQDTLNTELIRQEEAHKAKLDAVE